MHGVGAHRDGGVDDRRDVQIRIGGGCRPDADRFAHETNVVCFFVGFGVDAERSDAHLPSGARNAHRDLAAVGN